MSNLFLLHQYLGGFVGKERAREKSTWVGEPDVAFGVYKEIVDCVEVPAKVIV